MIKRSRKLIVFFLFCFVISLHPLLSSANSTGKGPKLKFIDKRLVELGDVRVGEKSSITIRFSNIGDEDLVIEHIQKSCTCTSADVDRVRLKKGDIGTVKIEINPEGKVGLSVIVVTVITNSVPSSSIIKISMNILN